MKRSNDFEKKLKDKLRNDLSAGAPDVWGNIEERTRESMRQAEDRPKSRDGKGRRWLFRGAASLAAVAILAAGFSFLAYKLPPLQAHAETFYDNGGHLNHISSPAPSENFIGSYNGFSLNILNQLDKGGSNVFLSPASIYLALGMTYNEAKGQTAAEFGKTLNNSKNLEGFDQDCLGLQNLITGSSRFTLANSIWLNSSYSRNISESFLDRDKNFFGSTVCTLDFSSSGAPGVINSWVKKNTGGRIDPSFKRFDPETVMALINTVYFKSDWKQQFNGQNTRDGDFKTPEGTKTVKFMHGEYTRYFENQNLQGIILPYDDEKTSMVILLPRTDLTDMLSKLTASDITAYVKGNINGGTEAKLSLPRVNLRYQASLNDPLKALGLKSAFDPDQADFSGMLKENTGLYISAVTHMTYLAIDEKGTEAAAATTVMMAGSAAPMKTNIMNVDHPFLTAIVNNETGAILFLGTVSDPSVSQ